MKCCYERNNCYDRYAIAATKRLRGRLADSAVGHLPGEISRATRFFLLRRVIVRGKVIGKNHRGSPLVHGGLEIPLQGTAEMDPKGIRQYLKTINRLSFQIIWMEGHFDDCTKQVLKGPEDDDSDTDEEVKATQIVKFDSHC